MDGDSELELALRERESWQFYEKLFHLEIMIIIINIGGAS